MTHSGHSTHALHERRRFLAWVAACTGTCVAPLAARAQTVASAPARVPIADMHSHLGVLDLRRSPADLATGMRTYGATLVSWKVVADAPWLVTTATGIEQRGQPTNPELWAHFDKTISFMLAYAQKNQLGIVRTTADLEKAVAGQASVVLASEGADFLGGDVALLGKAFDKGLRHLQLVHYIHSPVGDFSTEPPTHHGLSAMGKDLIKACEAQGVLVDLAHCSPQALDHALEVATKPMIWSHGWVEGTGGSYRDRFGFQRRRLSMAQAKKIAARGGVIGLWGLGLDRPGLGWNVARQDRAGYAREIAKLVNLLGADHVALGTDIAGLGENWTVNDYGHVRQVVEMLDAQKLNAASIEKVAFGNFVRVLRATLPGST